VNDRFDWYDPPPELLITIALGVAILVTTFTQTFGFCAVGCH
jgi:hypothetical protein